MSDMLMKYQSSLIGAAVGAGLSFMGFNLVPAIGPLTPMMAQIGAGAAAGYVYDNYFATSSSA